MKIRTQKGTLLRHLDFGIGLEHGISVSDIENGAILNAMNKMIEGDTRFESISSIKLRLSGSTLGIDMVVNIANGNGVVPITFDMRL